MTTKFGVDVGALRMASPRHNGVAYQSLPQPATGRPKRRPALWSLANVTPWTVLRYLVPAVLFAAWLFHHLMEVHIEIAFYRRGWIESAIKAQRPLSGTCFPPSPVYNRTLAEAPKALEPHAGLAMRFGSDCFDFASLVPLDPTPHQILPEHTIYHVYWRGDLKPVGEKQILLLKSLLATQDPSHSSIVLWSNRDLLAASTELAALQDQHPTRLVTRLIDIRHLARGTPMEDHPRLAAVEDPRAWVDGDIVRVLVLYTEGGVWVDMDHLVLRDLRPLLEHEWVTQWDCYDKPYQALNGAMMHFLKRSPYLCEMLYIMANDPPPRSASTDWGSLLYQKLWRRLVHNGIRPFKILPFCFTDGQTCRLDNRLPDPFSADPSYHVSRWTELERRLRAVFAIHLHNQWEKPFPQGGWIRRLVLPLISSRSGGRMEL